MKRRYLKDYTHDHNQGIRYTGKFYRSLISDEDRKKHSFHGAAAGILGIILTLAAISVNCLGNRTIYVVLPLEFTLLCYGYYLSGIACFFRATARMERRIYEGAFLRTVQSITIAVILQIFALLGEVFVIFMHKGSTGKEEFYLLFWTALAFGVNLFLWKKHRKLVAAVSEEKGSA